jgi:hypothetical protein
MTSPWEKLKVESLPGGWSGAKDQMSGKSTIITQEVNRSGRNPHGIYALYEQ